MSLEAKQETVKQWVDGHVQEYQLTVMDFARTKGGLRPSESKLLTSCIPNTSRIPVKVSFIDGGITRASWHPEILRRNSLQLGNIPMKLENLQNYYDMAVLNYPKTRGHFDRIRISAVLDPETVHMVMNLSEVHKERRERQNKQRPLCEKLALTGSDAIAIAALINCGWKTYSLTEASATNPEYGYAVIAAIAGGTYLACRLSPRERLEHLQQRLSDAWYNFRGRF